MPQNAGIGGCKGAGMLGRQPLALGTTIALLLAGTGVLRADDEIKIEVLHWSPLPSSNCSESSRVGLGSPIATLLRQSDCSRLLRFGIANEPSRAH